MNIALDHSKAEFEDQTVAHVLHSLASNAENLKDFASDPYYRRELIINHSKIADIQRDINAAIEAMWRQK